MKLIFLDMDGVLNNHLFNKTAMSCTVCPDNVAQLNAILEETGAKIVLSSAWRYIIAGNDMTLKGFEYLLRTHGVLANVNIIGITDVDEICAHCGEKRECDWPCGSCEQLTDRGDQIKNYLSSLVEQPESYVVIDDLNLGIKAAKHPFVETDSDKGLTEADAKRAIQILNG